jgi:ribose 5-phosphate isomerase B
MRILLASDHGGFQAKQLLAEWLKDAGYMVHDCGAYHHDPADDYVQYAQSAAAEWNEGDLGILLCRTGEGMAAAVNKHHGIVAAVAWNPTIAMLAREHNHADFLALPADHLSTEELYACVKAFLTTTPSSEPRHIRRAQELHQL